MKDAKDPLDRRTFLGMVLGAAAAGACGGSAGGGSAGSCDDLEAAFDVGAPAGGLPPVPEGLPAGLFALGVASGDPLHDRVVLWTRLAPEPTRGGGMPEAAVPVTWEVARDPDFARPVGEGTTVASPELAHAVHVDVAGLRPDTWYWYRFRVGVQTSQVGRTRTLACPDATPRALRFAVASCQHYGAGYYTAYAHMVEEDLDLVLFLGDYIYESAGNGVRQHEGPRPRTLVEYRNRYAHYRTDEHLQAAHAAFPWIATWDDHEVVNDYAGDSDANGVTPPEEFRVLRAAAYRAWYEHLPVRAQPPAAADLRIWRAFRHGDLLALHVLDTRQYRDANACPGGEVRPVCPERDDPARTMLGAEQRDWLLAGLRAVDTRWSAVAQSVVMTTVDFNGTVFNPDQWDGYTADRKAILDVLAADRARRTFVLTGDIHMSAVGHLTADAQDPDSEVVATEFVATSISSGGDSDPTAGLSDFLRNLKQVRYRDALHRGYLRCTVGRDTMQADFRLVDHVERPGAPVSTGASWLLRRGVATPDPTPLRD